MITLLDDQIGGATGSGSHRQADHRPGRSSLARAGGELSCRMNASLPRWSYCAVPVPFCPSAALPRTDPILRGRGRTSILAVRGATASCARFRNACRHRGMQLADKSGCQKAFVCRYTDDLRARWTPSSRAARIRVPCSGPRHQRVARCLPPNSRVSSLSLNAMPRRPMRIWKVFLSWCPRATSCAAPPKNRMQANWKIFAEGFSGGLSYRSLHRDTFYRSKFDNLNVVESFGTNSRIVFPYRNINKLREVPAAERITDGVLPTSIICFRM